MKLNIKEIEAAIKIQTIKQCLDTVERVFTKTGKTCFINILQKSC